MVIKAKLPKGTTKSLFPMIRGYFRKRTGIELTEKNLIELHRASLIVLIPEDELFRVAINSEKLHGVEINQQRFIEKTSLIRYAKNKYSTALIRNPDSLVH